MTNEGAARRESQRLCLSKRQTGTEIVEAGGL